MYGIQLQGLSNSSSLKLTGNRGPPCKHQALPWIKSTLKIARCWLSLGDSGFQPNFLGLFQVKTAKLAKKIAPKRKLDRFPKHYFSDGWVFR